MNVIKAPQSAGIAKTLPGLPAASAAPVSTAPTPAKAHLAAAADAPLTFDSAIKQVAAERARRQLTREGTAAEAGADAALGVSNFRSSLTRLRPRIANDERLEKDPKVTVWEKENRVRSHDKTVQTMLPGEVRLSDEGVEAMIVHVSGQKAIASVQGNEPFADGTGVPTDAFVQSQVTETIVDYLNKLASYGLDLKSVYRDSEHNDGVIRIFVNALDILNAAYVPSRNIYFFGNYKKSFPLGADKDTTVHECSHGLLDHIAPGLNRSGSEGGAFHEAFGDIMAALTFNNPGIGEDLGTFLVEHKDEDPAMRDGLRRVDNNVRLSPKVKEVHDRSLAYSGLMWSVKQALAKSLGNDDKACQLMQAAIVKGTFFITNQNPTSADIVSALAEGIRSHFAKAAPDQLKSTLAALASEAKDRGMLQQPKSEHSDIEPFAASSADDLIREVQADPQIKNRGDVSFEVQRDITFGATRKVTLRPVLSDAASGIKLPIEDSHLVCIMENGKATLLDDSTFSLPRLPKFRGGIPELAAGVDAAREIIHTGLEQQLQNAESEKEAAAVEKMLGSFDTLFADKNIKAEWVISKGTLCVSLQTLAGDFVVDVLNHKVWPRDTMRMEM